MGQVFYNDFQQYRQIIVSTAYSALVIFDSATTICYWSQKQIGR